jgi:hypothetical protein
LHTVYGIISVVGAKRNHRTKIPNRSANCQPCITMAVANYCCFGDLTICDRTFTFIRKKDQSYQKVKANQDKKMRPRKPVLKS